MVLIILLSPSKYLILIQTMVKKKTITKIRNVEASSELVIVVGGVIILGLIVILYFLIREKKLDEKNMVDDLHDVKMLCPKTWKHCDRSWKCRAFRMSYNEHIKAISTEENHTDHVKLLLQNLKKDFIKMNYTDCSPERTAHERGRDCKTSENFIKCLEWSVANARGIHKYKISNNINPISEKIRNLEIAMNGSV